MQKLGLRTENWCLAEADEGKIEQPWRKLTLHLTALSWQQLWKHHVIHSAALYMERHNEKRYFIWKHRKEICHSILYYAASLPPCIILTTVELYMNYCSDSWPDSQTLNGGFQIPIVLFLTIMIFHEHFWWEYPLGMWNCLRDFPDFWLLRLILNSLR